MLADGSEGAHAPEAQQLEHAELAGLPPVLAVRGEGDVGVVEGELLSRLEDGSAGEDDVVGFKDGLQCVAGGDDEGGDAAEAEEHDWAVLLGEAEEGVVGRGADLVEVADDGQPPWSWWQILLPVIAVKLFK